MDRKRFNLPENHAPPTPALHQPPQPICYLQKCSTELTPAASRNQPERKLTTRKNKVMDSSLCATAVCGILQHAVPQFTQNSTLWRQSNSRVNSTFRTKTPIYFYFYFNSLFTPYYAFSFKAMLNMSNRKRTENKFAKANECLGFWKRSARKKISQREVTHLRPSQKRCNGWLMEVLAVLFKGTGFWSCSSE